jgi:hypothetical protein
MRHASDDMIGRRLGPHIGGMIVEHDRRGRRTDLDERPAVFHRLDHFLIELKRPDQLQRRDHFQLFLGIFQKGLEEADAGCIDRDINAAHLILGRLGKSLDIRFLGQVAKRVTAANLAGEALQLLFLPPGDQYIRTLIMQSPGNDLTHIVFASCSKNNRSFSL